MTATYVKTNIHFSSYLTQFFLECKMFQIKIVDKIKTHVSYSINLKKKTRLAYDIMWRNIVELGRSQMTIWRMRIACWIPKSTNTHS
jgi:hypothetical protein